MDRERLPPRIGVLAIQGDYAAHAEALIESGAIPSLVKSPEDLSPGSQSLDGLILPGGESTTILKFLERRGLFESFKEFAATRPSSAPAPAQFCWPAKCAIRRNAASVSSMPPSSATPTAARSTPPS